MKIVSERWQHGPTSWNLPECRARHVLRWQRDSLDVVGYGNVMKHNTGRNLRQFLAWVTADTALWMCAPERHLFITHKWIQIRLCLVVARLCPYAWALPGAFPSGRKCT
jgi:hypothetical protein